MEFVLAGVALAQAVHELIEIGAGVHCGCSEVEGKGSSGGGHSGGDARGDGGVERIRENAVGSQSCNGFRQRVGRGDLHLVGVAEQGLFLRVQVGASGVDGSFAIADDDLCDGHAGGLGVADAAQESRDGRARRSGTIDDHFEALQGAVDDFAGVDQGG